MIELPPALEGLEAVRTEWGLSITARADAPLESFIALVRWIPTGYEMTFHDRFYPSVSDPGAYVSVQTHRDAICAYWFGNHGWSSDWMKQSPELIGAWLFLNRSLPYPGARPLAIKIEAAIRPAPWTSSSAWA